MSLLSQPRISDALKRMVDANGELHLSQPMVDELIRVLIMDEAYVRSADAVIRDLRMHLERALGAYPKGLG